MHRIKDWVRSHQIAAFYILAFAITYGLAFSWIGVMERELWLLAPLAMAAACGPALSGIIVSGVTNTRPKRGTRRSYWIAFLLAWVASVIVAVAHNTLINQVELSLPVVGLFIIAVVPVAFVISAASSRNPSIKEYVSSLVRLRGVWGWTLLALVLLPALIVIAIPVGNVLSGQPATLNRLPDPSLSLLGSIVITFLYQVFFFNATGEETGWRGFALPRLQARANPLIASLIIALFWAPWHFFLWQAEGRPVLTADFWVQMYTGHILFSIILVWICNRARGSILVAGIAHASANTAFAFVNLPNLDGVNLTWSIAALLMILGDQMWKKLASEQSVEGAVLQPVG